MISFGAALVLLVILFVLIHFGCKKKKQNEKSETALTTQIEAIIHAAVVNNVEKCDARKNEQDEEGKPNNICNNDEFETARGKHQDDVDHDGSSEELEAKLGISSDDNNNGNNEDHAGWK